MWSKSPALQFPQTDTQYSKIGLILALNKMIRYLTGKNFLMRARTATHFKSFFTGVIQVPGLYAQYPQLRHLPNCVCQGQVIQGSNP